MHSTSDTSAEQIPAAKSRPARERVLPVAQIYAVRDAEVHAGQTIITLVIGDERCPPKTHGIRASRSDWRAVVAALCAEDVQLRDQVREDLR